MPPARLPEVITFDCYGTLVDWEKGLQDALRALMPNHITGSDPFPEYLAHEKRLEAEDFRGYAEVVSAAADATLRAIGIRASPAELKRVARGVPAWPVFDDTPRALRALRRRGYRLGILSNVDNDLLAGTVAAIGVPIDFVVTAEDVGAYKPAAPHFEKAAALIGDAGWLHAAQSYHHDIQPAVRRGIPTVWINRKGETPSGSERPTASVRTLDEFTALLDAWQRSGGIET